jgi:hypothetical protein
MEKVEAGKVGMACMVFMITTIVWGVRMERKIGTDLGISHPYVSTKEDGQINGTDCSYRLKRCTCIFKPAMNLIIVIQLT